MLKKFKDDPLLKGLFPDSLKLANITPVHKKNKPTHKENYIQVSTLLLMSKIFERLTYDQLNEYLKQYLNIVLCGVRNAHSTQHTLLRLLQKSQNELDKLGFVGNILMDLSKAYNCLSQGLMIAKIEVYDIGKSGLNLLPSYLSNRRQRLKVNSSYSDWYHKIRGIPPGSILGHCYSIYLSKTSSFLLKEQT